MGDVHCGQGEWVTAEVAYREALTLGQATDDRRFLPRVYCGLAEVALQRGDTSGACACLREGHSLASPEDVEAQGMLLRLAGQVSNAQGHAEEALGLLRQSVVLLAGPPVPYELARSQRALERLQAASASA